MSIFEVILRSFKLVYPLNAYLLKFQEISKLVLFPDLSQNSTVTFLSLKPCTVTLTIGILKKYPVILPSAFGPSYIYSI